ncbi:glutamate 5-kinase [Lacticaseibacillus zhaodongensis]|uniref:glutamate 5-kinase n=1 Tax=Lacticaseibacillus zhaodongensis TaxID=2668065 RepID=UPI0012D37014|nr:glutamate 5-kinase [Lacticaseibacillus zhaodongensis]
MKRVMDAKRVVVKVGTSSLIYPTGKVNLQAIDRLAYTLAALNNQGYEMILVSSGAIGVGLDVMHMQQRPDAIAEQQALAAIGQSELMTLYTQRFSDYGAQVGQLLLTHDIFEFTLSRRHVLDTFNTLLKRKIIPIVNENDSVAVDELDHLTTFGDNDQLSALVTTRVDADLLIVLSDIDGLYDRDPNKFADARIQKVVPEITDAIMTGASGSSTRFGTGGMVTKLRAAARVMAHGDKMVLANGSDPRVIMQILAGEDVGTLFCRQTQEGLVTNEHNGE